MSLRHYDIISYHRLSKFANFVEHDKGYLPFKFQCSWLSGSCFIERGGNTPPQCYNEIKRPVLIEVNKTWQVYWLKYEL